MSLSPTSRASGLLIGDQGPLFERTVSATRAGSSDVGWFEPLLPSGTYTAVAAFSGGDFVIPITFDAARVQERLNMTVASASTSAVAVTSGRLEGAAMDYVEFGIVGGSWRVGRCPKAVKPKA